MRSYLYVIFLAIVIAVTQGCSSNEERSPEMLLKLSIGNNRLHKEENTTLKVIATFSDNSTKEVTNQVTWSVTPTDALKIQNQHLQAVQDGNITLQAKLGNTQSNILHVNVFWEINGHRLPPMPDEKLNNATLLGIDANNNGVRDDVEIWIFKTYKHPIVQAVAMQNARAFQIILVEPDKAKETLIYMHNSHDCNSYYRIYAEDYNETIVIPRHKNLYEESRPLILNTRKRSRAYYEYNQALSGGVYALRPIETLKSKCDFNATKVLRGEW